MAVRRSHTFSERASSVVLAEGPLVEPLAAVAYGFLGPDVGGGYDSVPGTY